MATCHEMNIETVAVYSDVDREALHVLEADQAVGLGPAAPSESYLHMDNIMKAARQTEAEAIHPGYGFLAENPALPSAAHGKAWFSSVPAPGNSDLETRRWRGAS